MLVLNFFYQHRCIHPYESHYASAKSLLVALRRLSGLDVVWVEAKINLDQNIVENIACNNTSCYAIRAALRKEIEAPCFGTIGKITHSDMPKLIHLLELTPVNTNIRKLAQLNKELFLHLK